MDEPRPGDVAAEKAKVEFEKQLLAEGSASNIIEWWKNHYIACGHKRLGRILVSTIKKDK